MTNSSAFMWILWSFKKCTGVPFHLFFMSTNGTITAAGLSALRFELTVSGSTVCSHRSSFRATEDSCFPKINAQINPLHIHSTGPLVTYKLVNTVEQLAAIETNFPQELVDNSKE